MVVADGQVTEVGDRRPMGCTIDTGGVVLPGLIDLHGHPEYNVFAAWEPPRECVKLPPLVGVPGDRYTEAHRHLVAAVRYRRGGLDGSDNTHRSASAGRALRFSAKRTSGGRCTVGRGLQSLG